MVATRYVTNLYDSAWWLDIRLLILGYQTLYPVCGGGDFISKIRFGNNDVIVFVCLFWPYNRLKHYDLVKQ